MNIKDFFKKRNSKDEQKRKFPVPDDKEISDFCLGKEKRTHDLPNNVMHFYAIEDDNPNLDTKKDNFNHWYISNYKKTGIPFYIAKEELNTLGNLIEKVAVWYELRYPEYEISRLMPGSAHELTQIDDVIFNNNEYINNEFDENSDVRLLEWDKVFNKKAFIKSLPWEERMYFEKQCYPNIVYLGSGSAHLHLTDDGIVEICEAFYNYNNNYNNNNSISNKDVEGMHIDDVIKLFEEKGINLSEDSEIMRIKRTYDFNKECKERLLNTILYRIIERGGNRIGPRRAFLFAKEFGLNIDIPMIYGVDSSDPGLRKFINEYLKSGGSKDLECFDGFLSNDKLAGELDKITIQELILTKADEHNSFYTDEENKLHERLVNILSSQINKDELEKEKVKQLKIER